MSPSDYFRKRILERDNYVCHYCGKKADDVSFASGRPYELMISEYSSKHLIESFGKQEWVSRFSLTKEAFDREYYSHLLSVCNSCKLSHEKWFTTPIFQLVLERDGYKCKLCGENAVHVVDLGLSKYKPMALLNKKMIDTKFGASFSMASYMSVCEKCRLENVSPFEFEEIIGRWFSNKNYSVSQIGGTGDGGVDLVCISPTQQKIIVQCKRYKGSVGPEIIRDFFGTLIHNSADYGYVVTTGHFTRSAIEFAKDKNITLIDKKTITEFLSS